MGITGLLPFVKSASSKKHVSNFKGQTAAIDSYCWLHRGAFGCAEKIARGEATNSYITFCMKFIDMLLTFKIKPVMVFDGRHLPAKLLTEKKRRESRNAARKKAVEYLKLGKMEEARANFKKCIDILPEMALGLIKECRRRGIDCIVAPYEADAQLAYLNITNMVDFVISEDSDLLAFGCKRVIFKLDLSGSGILVERDKLYLATQERPDSFSIDRFRHMCILSGCDYLESLPGIGLKKALKFLKRVSDIDIYNSITKLPRSLNMQLNITEEYRQQFMIADATFRHQLVFDPVKRKLLPLTDPVTSGTKLEYCCNAGDTLDNDIAFQIAVGNLEPFTLKVLDTWCPDTALKRHVNPTSSIWCKLYKLVVNAKQKVEFNDVHNKNITVDLKIPENRQVEIDDNIEETMITIYSAKEPPTKKICLRESVHEDNEKEQTLETSPILSGRREFINPFVKKAQTNLLKSFTAVKQSAANEKSKVMSNSCDTKYTNSVEEENIVETDVSDKTSCIKDNKTSTGNNDEIVVVVDGQTVVVSKYFYKQKINNSCETVTFKDEDRYIENSNSETIPNSQNIASSNYKKRKVMSNFVPKKYTNSVEEENIVVETDVSNKTSSIKDNKTSTENNDEIVVVVDGHAVVVSKYFSKQTINNCETTTCKDDDGNMENSDSETITNSQNTASNNYNTNTNCDNLLNEELSISQGFMNHNTISSQEINSEVDLQLVNTEEDSNNLRHSSKIILDSAASKIRKNTVDIKTAILSTNITRTNCVIQGEIKTCRQPGLRKRSSKAIKPDKNQPTLLSMFGFTKK